MDVIPPIYQFALLTLVAYRIWRLLAEDEILNRPRRWLVRLPLTWDEGDPLPKSYRNEWAIFFQCPWCLGFWVCLGTYISWMLTLGDTPDSVSDVFVALGILFAMSSVVGIIRAQLDPPDE